MASALFSAIGRGYSARTILNSIAKATPKYGTAITNAYYYGYTAEQILSRIASNRDKKNYDPDMFLTSYERILNNDQKNKKKALLKTLAATGTLAAVGAGMYALIQKNKAIRPDEILMPGQKASKKGLPYKTIAQDNKQIGYDQKLIPYNPKLIGHQKPLITPYTNSQQPQQGPPIAPQQPIQSNQAQVPSQQANQSPPSYTKSVDLVKNLREETRFNNLVGAGYDEKTTELMLRSTLPKETIALFDKSNGGLEQLVKDYSLYLKENPQVSAFQKNLEKEKQQQQIVPKNQEQKIEPQQRPQPLQQQPDHPKEEIQQDEQVQQQPSIQPTAPLSTSTPFQATKPLASLKNGKIGEVESLKNGVATINVDGKTFKEKASNITSEPPEIESAVREVINSIPENLKSTALQTMVYIPENRVLLSQFYDGKWAWYLDFDEDTYKNIALGTYQPKGQGKTGIAEYKPGVADSRGAGFHNEVKINPKYSKENKGKTWGYASNEYALLHSIQPIINKISKEKLDENGKVIAPKPRKKRQS